MEFKLISIASIIAFFGCYFVKMFHQKKQGIQTDQIGKNKVGFVKAGVSKTDKTELVTNGIYQISRNPAFLGFDLLYIGTLLMFFNWILCFLTVFAVIMYHLQIVNVEEDFLFATFGNEYLQYKKKVCRYISRKR